MGNINLTKQDHEQWLANPLTKALKQSHKNQAERDTALLRQALDCLTYTAPHHDCIDAATEYERMSEATITALRERLGGTK